MQVGVRGANDFKRDCKSESQTDRGGIRNICSKRICPNFALSPFRLVTLLSEIVQSCLCISAATVDLSMNWKYFLKILSTVLH